MITQSVLALAVAAASAPQHQPQTEAPAVPAPRVEKVEAPPQLTFEEVQLRLLEQERKDIRNSAIALTVVSVAAYGGAAALGALGAKEYSQCSADVDLDVEETIRDQNVDNADLDLGCSPGKVAGFFGGAGAVSLMATGFLTASVAQWVRMGVRGHRIRKLRKSH